MNSLARMNGSSRWIGISALVIGLLVPAAQADMSPGTGIKAGNQRISPFVEFSVGYDSNVRLASGEMLPLEQDGSYDVQNTKIDDTFSQFSTGVGLSRVLVSEYDYRLRGWYESRLYAKETDYNYDGVNLEGQSRYLPASDKYTLMVGGKYRESQDVERVPTSAATTMPGDNPLPYLEERDDRLKRVNLDGFGTLTMRPHERTTFSLSGNASTVDYDDQELNDYWNWALSGNAGYRYSEKTYVFLEGEYEIVEGDEISGSIPVYALRVGLMSKPRVKVDYKIGVGVKTYEYTEELTPKTFDEDQKWDVDFDGWVNWNYSEKLSLFGKAWTDVNSTIQSQSPEDTRRTYNGQIGADYAFQKRLNGVGALSYRLDAYDYPVRYGEDLVQRKSELWQVMGRLIMTPNQSAFWKVFLESSYEVGDNDLDTYDQWLVWLGASVWY